MLKINYTRFPASNFPVDGEAVNLLRACYGETGIMDFGLNAVHCGCQGRCTGLKVVPACSGKFLFVRSDTFAVHAVSII